MSRDRSALVRLFLDDTRTPTRGWELVYTVDDTIARLERGDVEELSLDYDLRESDSRTGLDVLRWIERRIATDIEWTPPRAIWIHSDNVTGRPLMLAAHEEIRQRLRAQGRPMIPKVW